MTTALSYAEADPVRRAVRWFAATGPGDWLFANVLRRLDGPVHRLTAGRHTAASLLSGLPVVQLTTTGARTGRERTVPVLGVPTLGGLAVFASNFGRPHQPGWAANLRAPGRHRDRPRHRHAHARRRGRRRGAGAGLAPGGRGLPGVGRLPTAGRGTGHRRLPPRRMTAGRLRARLEETYRDRERNG